MSVNLAKGIENLLGKEKAAILLITLGPEKSAKVFKHLKEDEIELLTLEIANISTVMPDIREKILDEFYQICLAQKYITEGGIDYAKEILEQAMGKDKAKEIINKLTVSLQVRPFDFVRKAESSQLLNFIQNEHPQTIALILSYLKPKQAAEVLVELEPERQAEVARRIALMDITSPDVINEVEKALEKKLASHVMDNYTSVGGVDSVVDILNAVDRATEKNIMESLETEDIELSEEIKKKMFVFEDILMLDNRSIQSVLRQDIDNKELAIALKDASKELKNLMFKNLSKRLAAMIEEEMEFMGPVRRVDVEAAQQKIVNIIRRLEDTGEIIISRGGGDDVVV